MFSQRPSVSGRGIVTTVRSSAETYEKLIRVYGIQINDIQSAYGTPRIFLLDRYANNKSAKSSKAEHRRPNERI